MKLNNLSAMLLSSLLASQLGACAPGSAPTLSNGSKPVPAPSATAMPPADPQPVPMPTAPGPTAEPAPTDAPAEPMPTAGPGLLDNLTGVWNGGNSGKYYLRQSGDTVLWYGESHPNSPAWAQVAIGKRDSQGQLDMNWYDVPKGESDNRGTLEAGILPDNTIAEQSHTGSLNETEWQLHTQAPSYPLVESNALMPLVPPAHDFTGIWKDLSGARFYLTQHNNVIVGYAESSPNHPDWSAVIHGRIAGDKLRLNWAGLPKSTQPSFSLSSGVQRMTSANENMLLLDDGNQGQVIGMSKWARVN